MRLKLYEILLLLSSVIAVLIVFSIMQRDNQTIVPQRNEKSKSETTVPLEFSEFYSKFHSDSTFQLNHIVFPLKGIRTDSLLTNQSCYWTKGRWKMHRSNIMAIQSYEQEFEIGKGYVTEKIYDNQFGFSMIRRFSRSKEDYQLIFYKEMGPSN